MDREQTLDLHDWADGTCFRHPAKGVVLTTHVKTIRPSAGGIQDVRACQECVTVMERERRGATRRTEDPGEPGSLPFE